jgi:hypothetical protein
VADLNHAGDLLREAYMATGVRDYLLPPAPLGPLDLPLVRRKIVEAAEIIRDAANPRETMPDQKKINRLKLMLGQATRCLEEAEPDLRVVETLLSGALALAMELREPPDPYANPALRPGLIRSQENSDG